MRSGQSQFADFNSPTFKPRCRCLPGDIISCREQCRLQNGQVRLRTVLGWVSLVARDGTALFSQLRGCTSPRRSDCVGLLARESDDFSWDMVEPEETVYAGDL